MKLIDADSILENYPCYEEIADVLNFIRNSPKIDAIPVVRCKNCIYYKPHTECFHKNGNPFYYCDHDEGMITPQENDFCSYGKKKETED